MKSHWRAATATLLLALGVTTPALAERVVLRVESGALAGEQDGSIAVFKGIPYAAAPVGELRWRPPQPVPRWHGVREADQFGAACPQDPALGGNPQPQSEDCLFLNVWAPSGARRGSLPVMVWLHGGGFVAGAGSQGPYEGAGFARDGVVLLTLNYRLGALGFFAHPALGGGANYTLLDQVAALEWVKHNISAFGGDPHRVTLFGESAGGDAVLSLLTAAKTAPLFQQAIAESAPGYNERRRTLAQEEERDIRLAAAAGVGAAGTAAQLRAIPPEKLFGDHTDVAPFIDGDLVTGIPLQSFETGPARKIPLLIGSNSNEGSIAAVYPQAVPKLLASLGDRADELRRAYGPVGSDEPRFERELFGDAIFGAALRHIATVHSKAAPTYLYQFDYLASALRDKRPGVSHVGEIPYVFDSLAFWPMSATDEDRMVATRVHACWVAFARSGRPACATDDPWSAYDPATDNTMVFSARGLRMENGYRAPQFDAIQALLYSTAPRSDSK
jgi:para-nitrobenzyl esterase